MKFTEKIGTRKLSVSYYQEKRLKKLDGIRHKTYPIYFTIIFNKETLRVRSILWKRLFETNNYFLIGIPFKGKDGNEILEGSADIERAFFQDKEKFAALCEYEFECLKRIIKFACPDPDTVKVLVDAYNFWGKDGLREVALRILNQLIDTATVKDPTTLRSVSMRSYNKISQNAANLLRSLVEAGQDPVSIISFIEETGMLDHLEDFQQTDLYEDFYNLSNLIMNLAVNSVGTHHQEKNENSSFGIYYFPKIHFFHPPTKDTSKRRSRPGLPDGTIRVDDVLKLQKLLEKAR